MTLLATSREMKNSAAIVQSRMPDSIGRTDEMPKYTHTSDEELLAAARNADGYALAELCRRHEYSIKKKIIRIVRNREDAEDVLQDATYKAFVHLYCFRGTCPFSVWLTRIAINSALMVVRKRRTRSELSYDSRSDQDPEWKKWDFPDRSPNPEQMYVRQQAIEQMLAAVNRLSPRYRDLVQQFHGTEQSLEETAEKLGIKVSTAKSRLLRARRRLRSSLEKRRISFADAGH
jgi:RNA polymerase sigma factor (sigma-70 family)